MGKEELNQGIIGPTPQEVKEANKGLIKENPLIRFAKTPAAKAATIEAARRASTIPADVLPTRGVESPN